MTTRTFFAGSLLAAFLIFPLTASALTNDEILARITQLLSHIQRLQAQLQQIEGGTAVGPTTGFVSGSTTGVSIATSGSGNCVVLTQTLKRGSRGDEVTKLQEFLARDRSVYPDGTVSGYFGGLTEAAVQRWQAKHGVVSSGTPAATGYGLVGPSTRKKMGQSCGGAAFNDAVARDLVITPNIGPVPLEATATFSLAGSSCSSFLLDWGDGSKPLSFDAGTGKECSRDIAHKRATHRYTVPGIHTAVFRAIQGPLKDVAFVSKASVSVGDSVPSGFALSPTSGSAPLATSITFPVAGSTCTSYEADWGDGTIDRHQAQQFTSCSGDSGTESLTHTYTSPGTYVVKFKTGHAPVNELEVNEEWRVVVEGDIVSDARVEVVPTAGEAPMIVQVKMSGLAQSCTSYELDWGDGSSVQRYDTQGAVCDSTPFEQTFTHTYIRSGSYTIATKLGTKALGELSTNTQTVYVTDPGTASGVRNTCAQIYQPVCGETNHGACPANYSCGATYKTFSNRCFLDQEGAKYAYDGVCVTTGYR